MRTIGTGRIRLTDESEASDKTLSCVDCSEPFTWSVNDQEFARAKGYERPKRCLPCRKANRERKAAGQWW